MHNDMHDMAECAASPPPEPGPVSIIPAAHAPYPSSQEEQCLNMMCCFIHTSALSMPAPDFPSSPWGFVLPGTEERLTSLAPQNLFRPPRA
jgi:hypothetical protein